ncbi:MAG TPA: PTS sugar transporter subunit IIA [Myxococcales bacterium]|nr:PTS sugar transporter subunit IIA [Myxococcales bacterium]
MRIAEFLREDLVFPDLEAADKAGVLAELCAGLAKAYPALSAQKLTETLLEREKLGSTGIGDGVAIPHGKLSGLPGLLAAFGRKRTGVDFAAIDGNPTYLFFVLFAPDNSAGLHLKALARISRLFKQPQLRRAILAANGPDGIFRLISEEDAKY